MRYTSEHKQETRQRVLTEAAREIRAKGPAGIAVAGIMARAGLTHGGFYAHFASKEDLVGEAILQMFRESSSRFDADKAANGDPRDALRGFVDYYLSAQHRDVRERGCALAALSGDLARLEEGPRIRFGKGVAVLTGRLALALGRHGVAAPDTAASSMLAELVGALTLSRAVGDPTQSDAILARVKTALIERFALEDPA
jgi:TetR/AcrR family transcriptional repressor of nem operon